MESKSFVNWNNYVSEHPEIADIEAAKVLNQDEKDMLSFVFGLFK